MSMNVGKNNINKNYYYHTTSVHSATTEATKSLPSETLTYEVKSETFKQPTSVKQITTGGTIVVPQGTEAEEVVYSTNMCNTTSTTQTTSTSNSSTAPDAQTTVTSSDTITETETEPETDPPATTDPWKNFDEDLAYVMAKWAYNHKNTVLVTHTRANGTTYQDYFSGHCAGYVKNVLDHFGLWEPVYDANGNEMNVNGCDMDNALENNENFREYTPTPTTQAELNKLPPGCILCYERGQSGYNKKYGHVEITTGNGRAVSDGVTYNLRLPSHVYYPVKH